MQYGGDPQCCSALAGDKREEKPLTSGSLGNCGCPAPPFMTGFLCYKSVTKWILYYEGTFYVTGPKFPLLRLKRTPISSGSTNPNPNLCLSPRCCLPSSPLFLWGRTSKVSRQGGEWTQKCLSRPRLFNSSFSIANNPKLKTLK